MQDGESFDGVDGGWSIPSAWDTVFVADEPISERPTSGSGYPRQSLLELVPLLRARALKLCKNPHESDDLVQETLLRALRFEAQFVSGTNLRAWLCTVLGNVFISRCRSRERERRALSGWGKEAELHAPPSASPDLRCIGSGVERALNELPAPFAQVVRLVDLEDQAYNDVASRLGIPVGTVMSRLFRARRLLALRLAEAATA